jgi:hypothetical protein
MKLLKFLLMDGFLALGSFLLATGLREIVPTMKYLGVAATDVPVGIAFLVGSVALAKVWRIEEETVDYDSAPPSTSHRRN